MKTAYIRDILDIAHLIPAVLQHGHFEQLRVLDADTTECEISLKYLDIVLSEFFRFVGLVDDLRYTNYITLIITYWHR